MNAVASWIVALLAVPAAAGCLAPLIGRWFADTALPLHWSLSFGLSLGALTLILSALGFWQLNGWLVFAVVLGLWLISSAAGRWRWPTWSLRASWQALRAGEPAIWIGLVLLGILLVVLAQATYYPFTGDDEISRYGYFARLIFESQGLTADVRGYPPLLPLAYAIPFLTARNLAEQAAKLFPVLFAVTTVLATSALARRWFGRWGGWGAAFVLAATPAYISWAAVGYVDIPSALYFVLGAYAADVWREQRELRWALLTGTLTGLALWTKQAGFAMLPTLGVIVLAVVVAEYQKTGLRGGLRPAGHGLLMLLLAFLAGGWWYVRNATYDGWLGAVPGPGIYYAQLVTRSPLQLIPFVGHFAEFGWLTAPLYLAGLGWALLRGLHGRRRAAVWWCLLWCGPYTLLWWWSFSYDARFLLTVLPFYASLVGGLSAALAASHAGRFSRAAVAGAIVVVATVGAAQARLGGAVRWITHPTATYAERVTRAKGDLYPTYEFLRDHTDPAATIASMDGRLTYYLINRPITVDYPASTALLAGYDYFVVGSWAPAVYAGLGRADDNPLGDLADPEHFERVYSGPAGDLTVYRIREPDR